MSGEKATSVLGEILIIEDDDSVATILSDLLIKEGYGCEVCSSGPSGVESAAAKHFDAVILDITLPGLNGLDVCKKIKAKNPALPILMLTARSDEADVVSGLEVGADDYILKPFRPKEIVARVRARLRESARSSHEASVGRVGDVEAAPFSIGELTIDPNKRSVIKRGVTLTLSSREYRLVELLASHPGKPFSREDLLESVWEFTAEDYDSNVSILISRLRKKLEDDQSKPRYLLTVRGFGYRFAESKELEGGET